MLSHEKRGGDIHVNGICIREVGQNPRFTGTRIYNWVVVSHIHPDPWGKDPILIKIFQMG